MKKVSCKAEKTVLEHDEDQLENVRFYLDKIAGQIRTLAEIVHKFNHVESVTDDVSDDKFEVVLETIKFFPSIMYRTDHPFRPFVAKHIQNGTCITREEGREILKKYADFR